MKLVGEIVSGYGKGARDVRKGAYENLGFDPFPGTLNVLFDEDPDLRPPDRVVRVGAAHVSMWRAIVDGSSAWVIKAEKTTHEIISPLYLRGRPPEVEAVDIEILPGLYDDILPAQGGSTSSGFAYHDIPGEAGQSHRSGTAARVAHLLDHLDVDGLAGLDLGCSVGGVSLGLAEAGASMVGLDHDRQAIEVANRVSIERDLDASFFVGDLDDDDTWQHATGRDFCVWLSNWMWIAKQVGDDRARHLLHRVSSLVPVLVFETAEGGVSQAGSAGMRGPDDVEALLREVTDYETVENIGTPLDGWYGRSVFLCRSLAGCLNDD